MTIKRTTQSQQGDTLDSIAYRFFGNSSNSHLPDLVKLNPTLTPNAILPMRTLVFLPSKQPIVVQQRLKIWN